MENFESQATDYIQPYHMNKSKEFQKDVQITFFIGRDLSYVKNKSYVSETWYEVNRYKNFKSQIWGSVYWQIKYY